MLCPCLLRMGRFHYPEYTCVYIHAHVCIYTHLCRALKEGELGVIHKCGTLASYSPFPFLFPLCLLSAPKHHWPDEAFRKTDVFQRHAQERHGVQRPHLIPGTRKGGNTSTEYIHMSQFVAAFATILQFLKSPVYKSHGLQICNPNMSDWIRQWHRW